MTAQTVLVRNGGVLSGFEGARFASGHRMTNSAMMRMAKF